MSWRIRNRAITTRGLRRKIAGKGNDMNSNDLWEALGSLEEDQALQVLTQLFARYEQRREQYPNDPASENFFKTWRSSWPRFNPVTSTGADRFAH